MNCRTLLLLPAFWALSMPCSMVARAGDSTQTETDPLVLKKLEWFQDQKFGLLMHWGPYSQWGVVESWSLCPEDEPWCVRRGEHATSYGDYVKAYERLKTTFNPVRFDPDRWAAAARRAGMRYVVFTTKHHDGFCMFDTRQTTYRITESECPFSADRRSNVTREIFRAFRGQGFGIGAYFSKPDWHSPDYWWPYFPPRDRNVNYAIDRYPEKWAAFRQYTYSQIEELVTGYGQVDILWLDGGWVNPGNRGQDIDIPRIARMARSHQPGMIIVDRAVGGRYENYRTPEQEVPDAALDVPWETCMTMGTSWSYVPGDVYKPARQLIHLLVDIVAKGGNFLVNIGPDPLGELPRESLERLEEIGRWMDVNGTAIYRTRPVRPYREGNLCYVRRADGSIAAIYLAGEKEEVIPQEITLQSIRPRRGSRVSMLGVQEPLAWESTPAGTVVHLPGHVREHPPCQHAWALVLEEPESTP